MYKLALFLLLSIGFSFKGFSQNNPRPNILWITIEDTSPQFIGAYGNTSANTPNIDALAAGGIKFMNAFSTGTVCSPSRSCIVTGIKTYKLGTGNHRSFVPVPDYVKGFPYYLQQAGYYTTNNKKTDYNIAHVKDFINEAWDENSGTAGWWNRKPGQPFFAVFNFMESHQSRTMTWPYGMYKKEIYDKLRPEERIADDAFPLPPIYQDSPELRKQFARVYNSLRFTDNKIGDLLKRLEKDHLRDSTIIFFYSDHGEGMPRGKTNGINYGYRVPMVIWFPPKYAHLSPWGKAGSVSTELVDFEDLAPTVISLAQGKVPDYMTGRIWIGKDRTLPVNQLFLSNDRSDNSPDMVRTITDGRFVYSRNFMPFEPELRYIRYMEIGAIKQQMRADLKEGKLNDFQKSLFQPRSPEMLYDIKKDLWEEHNLANDPAYADQLARYRKTLIDHMISEQDVLLLPEYQTNTISKSGEFLFEHRQNPKLFPVKNIAEVAALSGFRNSETTKKQVKFLGDVNNIIRYWAIVGLRCQSTKDLGPYKNEIKKATNDSYPPVSIYAAAIAYDSFNSQKAAEILKKYCLDPNNDLALMAINLLSYVDKSDPFIETIKAVKERDGANYNVKASCLDFLGKLDLIPNDYKNRD